MRHGVHNRLVDDGGRKLRLLDEAARLPSFLIALEERGLPEERPRFPDLLRDRTRELLVEGR